MGLIFESFLLELLVTIIIIILSIYFFKYNRYTRYWESLNMPYLPYGYSLMNAIHFMVGSLPTPDIKKRSYDYFKDSAVCGVSEQNKYAVLVRDPKLIEQICIKDFSIFYNHGFKMNTDLNPLSKHLFFLEDVQWRLLRNKLSPAFSTGKLKGMYDTLLDSSGKVVQYVSTFEEAGNPVDIMTIMSKFTIDFIASSAFGLSINTLTEDNSEFIKHVNRMFRFGNVFTKATLLLAFLFPKIGSLFNIRMFPKEFSDYFISMVSDTIKYRENNNVQRNDMFQLMMEVKKNDEKNPDPELNFDDVLMAANCFVFFVGGYESIANPSSLLLYEISLNKKYQDKIYEEIQSKSEKYNGKLSYEALKEMTYLDQAVSEILRKYPPIAEVTREAKCDFTVPNTSIVIPKGSLYLIPIYGLHRDPKYFPDPEKFDPDRFDKDKEIEKSAYLPFGQGPRMCIASRLALLEIKVIVAMILKEFQVEIDERTQLPLKFNSQSFFWSVEGGLWLKLKSRKKQL